MSLPVTAVLAGAMALWMLYLGFVVIRLRRRHDVSTGNGGNRDLECAIRAHGNACEYLPIALILMALAEGMGAPAWLLASFGLALAGGRFLHGWYFLDGARVLMVRVAGMVLTVGVILLLALGAILHGLARLAP